MLWEVADRRWGERDRPVPARRARLRARRRRHAAAAAGSAREPASRPTVQPRAARPPMPLGCDAGRRSRQVPSAACVRRIDAVTGLVHTMAGNGESRPQRRGRSGRASHRRVSVAVPHRAGAGRHAVHHVARRERIRRRPAARSRVGTARVDRGSARAHVRPRAGRTPRHHGLPHGPEPRRGWCRQRVRGEPWCGAPDGGVDGPAQQAVAWLTTTG